MKKLAIFVEGYTELLFLHALLEHIAGANNILIEQRQIRGGSSVRRTMGLIRAANPTTDQKYYVLLVDCGGDKLVKDRIREEHESLSRQGYEKIIGIRDVRPDFKFEDVPRLEAGLPKYIRTNLIPVEFILSIMELEAWFLAEYNHYPKIDPAITVPVIKAALGFDPQVDDMSVRDIPWQDLDACYKIAGKSYLKNAANLTVDNLDYDFLYVELAERIGYLKRLVNSINDFLS